MAPVFTLPPYVDVPVAELEEESIQQSSSRLQDWRKKGLSNYHLCQPSAGPNLFNIPDQILIHIFGFLGYGAICQVRQVCRKFLRVSLDPRLDAIMFRQPVQEAAAQALVFQYALSYFPGSTWAIVRPFQSAALQTPLADFPIQLHPILCNVKWMTQDGKFVLQFPIAPPQGQVSWLNETATSPALARIGIITGCPPSPCKVIQATSKRGINVGAVLDTLHQLLISSAGYGTDMRIVRDCAREGNGVCWLLQASKDGSDLRLHLLWPDMNGNVRTSGLSRF